MRVRHQGTDDAEEQVQQEQIIGVRREQEAGATTAEVCRRHGVSEQTFYRWKAEYGGMAPSDAARLKSLEDENRRLKKLLAEAILDLAALKDMLGKTDPARRAAGPPGDESATSSTTSGPTSATTTSSTPATLPRERIML